MPDIFFKTSLVSQTTNIQNTAKNVQKSTEDTKINDDTTHNENSISNLTGEYSGVLSSVIKKSENKNLALTITDLLKKREELIKKQKNPQNDKNAQKDIKESLDKIKKELASFYKAKQELEKKKDLTKEEINRLEILRNSLPSKKTNAKSTLANEVELKLPENRKIVNNVIAKIKLSAKTKLIESAISQFSDSRIPEINFYSNQFKNQNFSEAFAEELNCIFSVAFHKTDLKQDTTKWSNFFSKNLKNLDTQASNDENNKNFEHNLKILILAKKLAQIAEVSNNNRFYYFDQNAAQDAFENIKNGLDTNDFESSINTFIETYKTNLTKELLKDCEKFEIKNEQGQVVGLAYNIEQLNGDKEHDSLQIRRLQNLAAPTWCTCHEDNCKGYLYNENSFLFIPNNGNRILRIQGIISENNIQINSITNIENEQNIDNGACYIQKNDDIQHYNAFVKTFKDLGKNVFTLPRCYYDSILKYKDEDINKVLSSFCQYLATDNIDPITLSDFYTDLLNIYNSTYKKIPNNVIETYKNVMLKEFPKILVTKKDNYRKISSIYDTLEELYLNNNQQMPKEIIKQYMKYLSDNFNESIKESVDLQQLYEIECIYDRLIKLYSKQKEEIPKDIKSGYNNCLINMLNNDKNHFNCTKLIEMHNSVKATLDGEKNITQNVIEAYKNSFKSFIQKQNKLEEIYKVYNNLQNLLSNDNKTQNEIKDIFKESLKEKLDEKHDIDTFRAICNCLLLAKNGLNDEEIVKKLLVNFKEIIKNNDISIELLSPIKNELETLAQNYKQYLDEMKEAYCDKLESIFNKEKDIFINIKCHKLLNQEIKDNKKLMQLNQKFTENLLDSFQDPKYNNPLDLNKIYSELSKIYKEEEKDIPKEYTQLYKNSLFNCFNKFSNIGLIKDTFEAIRNLEKKNDSIINDEDLNKLKIIFSNTYGVSNLILFYKELKQLCQSHSDISNQIDEIYSKKLNNCFDRIINKEEDEDEYEEDEDEYEEDVRCENLCAFYNTIESYNSKPFDDTILNFYIDTFNKYININPKLNHLTQVYNNLKNNLVGNPQAFEKINNIYKNKLNNILSKENVTFNECSNAYRDLKRLHNSLNEEISEQTNETYKNKLIYFLKNKTNSPQRIYRALSQLYESQNEKIPEDIQQFYKNKMLQ